MAKKIALAMGIVVVSCGQGGSADSATVGMSAGASSASDSTAGPTGAPTTGATDSAGMTDSAAGTDSMSATDSGQPSAGATDSASGTVDSSPTSGATTDTNSATDTASASNPAGATDTDSGGGTASGTDSASASAGDPPGPSCAPSVCEHDGKVYACGDCQDNDDDGLSDCADPECFGPCDDSESEFGSPLEDKDPCKQDCYFDGNAGQGGGDCQWNLKCDPLEPGGLVCGYNPNLDPDPDDDDYGKCVDGDRDTCWMFCDPPNGCDCFGCCTIAGVDRFIGSPGCSYDDLEACNACTKQDQLCGNPCDDGEVCFPDMEVSRCD